MPAGRPTTYTEELGKEICHTIANSSKSLRTISIEFNVPLRTLLDWLSVNKEFSQQYAQAKEQQADFLAEEMLEIADETSDDTIYTDKGPIENREWINRSRLRVDTRKWIASKLKPKKYADRVDLTSGGDKLQPTQILALPTEALKQLEQIITNATSSNNQTDITGDTQGIV